MRTKSSLFSCFTSQCDFDIYVIIETWLTSEFYDNEFFNPNLFTVYRKDRDSVTTGCSRGGGVLIAVRKYITSKLVPLEDGNLIFDQLSVIVDTLNGRLFICASYIPPNSSETLYRGHVQNFLHFTDCMLDSDRCCYVGDFNLSSVVWSKAYDAEYYMPSNVNKDYEIYFLDSLFSLDVHQINGVFNKLLKMLDLIFVSADLVSSVLECVFPLAPPNNHHMALNLLIDFYQYVPVQESRDRGYNFDNCDFHMLNRIFETVDWVSILDSNIVAICYETFLGIVNNILLDNVPRAKPRICIDDNDVLAAIDKLSISFRNDVDGLSSFLLRKCSRSLILPLKIIFSKSLKSGFFLQKWKYTIVVPVYKSGQKSNVTNYRPISKLSNVAKLIEHIVNDKLLFMLRAYISPAQHGFFHGRSTVTNLAVFTQFCISNFEKGRQIDAIYTDFAKAFDKVPHNLLLHKLSKIGFQYELLCWLRSYLSSRMCVVDCEGCYSQSYVLKSGIPQGSVLGPLLFNIYINDVSSCFLHSNYLLYADDLKIFSCIRNSVDVIKLQEDLDRLSFWTLVNGLPLNLKKCQKLVFHRCRDVVISDYTICSQLLESVNGKLDLGVVFDSKLNFSDHLNYIIPRAYSSLYFIRRNADEFADPYTKKILYCAYVRSKLEYCSFVWSPNALKHINRIESVQKKFVKFALKSLNFSHPMPSYVSRCALISLQSLRSRREIDSLVFLQGIGPYYFQQMRELIFIKFSIDLMNKRHHHTESFTDFSNTPNMLKLPHSKEEL
ncbi:uncharacterized protein LOC142224560 [Haematobia irritans]|uniref:uncharacterized protein LOC142224560 n=1 Tax=Haematobia irritans TaxID=7368 RepID=UPI003F4F6D61